MSNISGQYNSVYNQNVLRNVFQPAYLFESGTFKSRLDAYIPGNVIIGDNNTNYNLVLNGINLGAVNIAFWSTFPAVSTVNLNNNDISGCSNIYVSNVIANNITTTTGNITVPQGNIVLTSGNIVALGNINGTRVLSTTSVVGSNIGTATLFCVNDPRELIVPYSIHASYVSVSFSNVTDSDFSSLFTPTSLVLPPYTLFTSSNATTSITISNVSSTPLFTKFPYLGYTPNLNNDSYILRAI